MPRLLLLMLLGAGLCACAQNSNHASSDPPPSAIKLQAAYPSDAEHPADAQPIILGAAKNEWASFAIQIAGLPRPAGKMVYSLRIQPLQLTSTNGSIAPDNYSAFQVLAMPVDVNRAGYVRHTGLSAANRRLPRALLPMPMERGVLNLTNVRGLGAEDARTRTPEPTAGPVTLWIDIHIPPEARAGEYQATCDLLQAGNNKPLASLPIKLTLHDFVLPDERHLLMVSQISWDSLRRLYPDQFEAVSPQWLNRKDPRYTGAIKAMDQLVNLAQKHRTQVVIPRLQPTVKWPAGKAPLTDWQDFDSVVMPWLGGSAFADRTPLGFWPLPPVDYLDRFDRQSQLEYWTAAASHFDQLDWLAHSAVFLEKGTPGRAGAADSIQLSSDAAQILGAHPRIRVAVPLEDDQVQLAGEGNPKLIEPAAAGRIIAAAPGLVFVPPTQEWPTSVPRPQHWLRTDLPGLVPYAGAGGDERDVRVWAWLAYLRQAQLIQWKGALPAASSIAQPADPNDLIWFYPGSWFGVDEPVPTIQLKWLRRAQQDYEYLWLARQRGEVLNALLMARLIAKPVEIQPNQPPDPTCGLMSGTTDPQAWADVQRLLARTILLRQPGQAADPSQQHQLNLHTLQWMEPQERPLLLGRSVQWSRDTLDERGNWIDLRLGIDIYNASDNTPDDNTLQWTALPAGWQIRPQAIPVSALATYQVKRFMLNARFDLDKIAQSRRQPMELTFTNGFNKRTVPLRLMIPVAASDRREGRLSINGSLEDWDAADAIQEGPMAQLLSRPALQRQELPYASTPTSLYTGWADENFYLAFKLGGLSTSDLRSTRNFVDYQFRRAWGEDLCQVIVQPVYRDNTVGPILHLVCKPSGGHWVERKLDPRTHADPWQALEGAGIRYAATMDGDTWRGEVAIPWKAINDGDKGMPVLLRFNFVQHQAATGQSASWAGPIDFGRDDAFMGLLYLRQNSRALPPAAGE